MVKTVGEWLLEGVKLICETAKGNRHSFIIFLEATLMRNIGGEEVEEDDVEERWKKMMWRRGGRR